MYAASGDSVYKSTDYGDNWIPAGQGLPRSGLFFAALVLDPQDPSTLYVGGGDFRPGNTKAVIYNSTDGGKSWRALDIAAPEVVDKSFRTLAVIPGDPPTILAGTNAGALLRSTDGGLSWGSRTLGSIRWGMSVAVDPTNANNIYVAGDKSERPAVYKSSDKGATWKAIEGTFSLDGGVLTKLAVAPSNPQTLYLATSYRIYKSSDAGKSWQDITKGLPRRPEIRTLAVSPSNADTLYLGLTEFQCRGTCQVGSLWRSTDGGETWTSVFKDLRDIPPTTLALDPSAPDRLYIGTYGFGLYRSEDGGATRYPASKGLEGAQVFQFVVDTGPPRTLYALTRDALYKGAGGAANWTRADKGLERTSIAALALNRRTSPSTLYVLTFDDFSGSNALYKSTDRGETWLPTGKGLPSHASPISLVLDPGEPQTMFAGFGGVSDIDPGRAIYRSTDGGDSWTVVWSSRLPDGPGVAFLAIDPSNHSVLYAAGYFRGLHKSTDGGNTWRQVGVGLLDSSGQPVSVSGLAIDPQSPSTIYVAAFGAVFKSTDGGATWARSSTDTTMGTGVAQRVSAIAINPRCSRIIYAGLETGLFRSNDAGESWYPAWGDALADREVTRLVIDPARPSEVYAGTRGAGLFLLRDPEAGRCPSLEGEQPRP